MEQLDRPIFLVGHARGGSTLLGSIIALHPDVGPKPDFLKNAESIEEVIRATRDPKRHYEIAAAMEQKDVWFDYFSGKDVFTTMGREIITESVELSRERVSELVERLTEHLEQPRFFSKAPTNSFRIRALLELFPDAKIVALYRKPEEVIASYLGWNTRPAYLHMGYRKCVTEVGRRWADTFAYVEACRKERGFLALTYDDLVDGTERALEKVFNYCELSPPGYIEGLQVADRRDKWKQILPRKWQLYVFVTMLRYRLGYEKIKGKEPRP